MFHFKPKKIRILKVHPFKEESHIRSQWFGLDSYIKQCSWHRSITNSLVVILNENVYTWKPAERWTRRCWFPVLSPILYAGKAPACCCRQMPDSLFGGKSLSPPLFIPTSIALSCRLSLFILSLVLWQPLVFHPNSKSYFLSAFLLENHTVRFMYLHQKTLYGLAGKSGVQKFLPVPVLYPNPSQQPWETFSSHLVTAEPWRGQNWKYQYGSVEAIHAGCKRDKALFFPSFTLG